MNNMQKLKLCLFAIPLFYLGGAASAAGLGNNIAVRLVGTADMYNGDTLFEKFDLPAEGALCYDLDLVDGLLDRVVILRRGRLVELDATAGALRDVYRRALQG